MEMERINENLIKVYIDVEDLEERGVNFLDLISDQKSVEKFFYSILEEVDVEHQFYDSEAITFQVIPSNDGIELYISRSNYEEIDNLFEEEVVKRLRERKSQIEDIQQKSADDKYNDDLYEDDLEDDIEDEIEDHFEDDIEKKSGKTIKEVLMDTLKESKHSLSAELDRVVKFENLDSFIKFAREEKDCGIEGELFHMNQHYYFVINNADSIEFGSDAYYTIIRMMDFGEPHSTTDAVLEEYGEFIRSIDAISYFGHHF